VRARPGRAQTKAPPGVANRAGLGVTIRIVPMDRAFNARPAALVPAPFLKFLHR
jgi:hypothetical protein